MVETGQPGRVERRLVVTVAVGSTLADLAELTVPGQQAYARRLGAEHRVLNEPRICAAVPYYEIFQLYDLFEDYDRILYLDLDVLVRPNCPDLFELVPPDFLGVFLESRLVDRSKAIRQINNLWSPLHWSGDYFNNGVMVLSAPHRNIFKVKREYPTRLSFYDQTVHNYLAVDNEFDVFDLGIAFNYMPSILGHGAAARFLLNHVCRGVPRIPWLYQVYPEPQNAFMVHLAAYEQKKKVQLTTRLLEAWDLDCSGSLSKAHLGLNRVFHGLRLKKVDGTHPSIDPFSYALRELCDEARTVDEIAAAAGELFPSRSVRAAWNELKRSLNALIDVGAVRALNQLN